MADMLNQKLNGGCNMEVVIVLVMSSISVLFCGMDFFEIFTIVSISFALLESWKSFANDETVPQ